MKRFIPKRKYRERPQLAKREHLGFLEKKRDYKQRSKSFHRKEDMLSKSPLPKALGILREKGYNKNEDEFYHKMIRTRFRVLFYVFNSSTPMTGRGVHRTSTKRKALEV